MHGSHIHVLLIYVRRRATVFFDRLQLFFFTAIVEIDRLAGI